MLMFCIVMRRQRLGLEGMKVEDFKEGKFTIEVDFLNNTIYGDKIGLMKSFKDTNSKCWFAV